MRFINILWLGGLALASPPPEPPPSTDHARVSSRLIALRQGRWLTPKGFVQRTMYMRNGRLYQRPIGRVDSVVDLAGRYVVPPLADAHNHTADQRYGLPLAIQQYLREGVFYLKNPNSLPAMTAQVRPLLNQPTSIDVLFSNGGLTAPDGHPIPLYNRLAGSVYRTVSPQAMEGQAYHTIRSAAELGRKWPIILRDRPDFIKIYLLYSEQYSIRQADTTYRGQKGLDPSLVPVLVERAHRAGLTVSAHIETAHDFAVAVRAGVDEINHLPGYVIPKTMPVDAFQLSPGIARLAAKRRIGIVTTTLVARRMPGIDSIQLGRVEANQMHNLAVLRNSGCRILIGCDTYDQTARAEMKNVARLGVFSLAELLRIACHDTPRHLFPNRLIGRLEAGYEASFLVLDDNPLRDIRAMDQIHIRCKQGQWLTLPPSTQREKMGLWLRHTNSPCGHDQRTYKRD